MYFYLVFYLSLYFTLQKYLFCFIKNTLMIHVCMISEKDMPSQRGKLQFLTITS